MLVVGGTDDNQERLASALLYNAGHWDRAGSMGTKRTDHVSVLLQSGAVLVVGGLGEGEKSFLATCEIYNPSTGEFTDTGNLTVRRVEWRNVRVCVCADFLCSGAAEIACCCGAQQRVCFGQRGRQSELFDERGAV